MVFGVLIYEVDQSTAGDKPVGRVGRGVAYGWASFIKSLPASVSLLASVGTTRLPGLARHFEKIALQEGVTI